MFAARAGGWWKLSSPRVGARSKARFRWRSRSEHGRDGRIQSGEQLEHAAPITVRRRNHAAAVAPLGRRKNSVSRAALSRVDDHESGGARPRIQLPVWWSGDTSAFAADEIGSIAAPRSD